jgi:hypothetical protein
MEAATTREPAARNPAGASRAWRVVALVAAAHVLVFLVAALLFSGIGLGNDALVTCGGG